MRNVRTGLNAVPRGVWALGFVSLFTDISSEMIHSLLPVFLVTGLGASVALVGLIEGIAEATASVTKLFSGWLSDRIGKRKRIVLAGYGLAALSKAVFPLAVTPFEVLGARFADRVGKGIRDAPRDALIADITPPKARGAAYGLRQALDTVGAVLGPLLVIALMTAFSGNMRAVFAWAVLPAAVSVLLLAIGVEEPRKAGGGRGAQQPIRWAEVRGLGAIFWMVVGVGILFTMARFSEAFLILRAGEAGLSATLAPLVMVVMSTVYALVAAPAGSLSDRIDRRLVLAAGLTMLIVADLVLALVASVAGVLIGAALWGAHMGLTQGLLAALVADVAPERLRGTAFGLFNLATGVTLLGASGVAGLLWSVWGSSATFLAGAGFAAVALVGAVAALRRAPPSIPA